MIKGFINGKEYSCQQGENLHAVMAKNGYIIDAPCGGKHHCGKCKIKVNNGMTDITADEKKFLTQYEIDNNIRLSCFFEIHKDFNVSLLTDKYEIQTDYKDRVFEINPKINVNAFSIKHGNCIGIAIDIGTTTVVAAFYNLINGEFLDMQSDINAQKIYGADVMSRIEYAMNTQNGNKILSDAIIGQINNFIRNFELNTNISVSCIAQIVIAGNTTMELLAAGYNIKSLSSIPFIPESYLGEEKKAADLGYSSPNADVYFMPVSSGFFGGDAIAVILATNFNDGNVNYMVDIGTNGEMAISDGEQLFGCSTAAGPAFEGASIRFGTGSIKGAIKRVILSENGEFLYKTIEDKKAAGICGSGLIDIVALSVKKEFIDETGRISDDLEEFEDDYAIKIGESDIWITQKDVREIQLAKSAIRAGAEVLINTLNGKEIQNIYIAGGFGTAINLENAATIGLLPEKLLNKASVIGNGSLLGSIMVLLSQNNREIAEKTAEKTAIIDLSTDKLFQDEYVNNMFFEV